MEDQGFGLPGDIEKQRVELMAHYWGKPVNAPVDDMIVLMVELQRLRLAIRREMFLMNNPSAWGSFSQEGSDAIERIAKAAGLKK